MRGSAKNPSTILAMLWNSLQVSRCVWRGYTRSSLLIEHLAFCYLRGPFESNSACKCQCARHAPLNEPSLTTTIQTACSTAAWRTRRHPHALMLTKSRKTAALSTSCTRRPTATHQLAYLWSCTTTKQAHFYAETRPCMGSPRTWSKTKRYDVS